MEVPPAARGRGPLDPRLPWQVGFELWESRRPARFKALAESAFEFAVIAGARGTADGYNPLIPGDDDGTVRVEETRLPGATDFMTVPAIHSFLMNNPAVIDASLRFLKEGQLRSEPGRTPIPQGP